MDYTELLVSDNFKSYIEAAREEYTLDWIARRMKEVLSEEEVAILIERLSV